MVVELPQKVRKHHHTTLSKVERFIESLKKQVKKLKKASK